MLWILMMGTRWWHFMVMLILSFVRIRLWNVNLRATTSSVVMMYLNVMLQTH